MKWVRGWQLASFFTTAHVGIKIVWTDRNFNGAAVQLPPNYTIPNRDLACYNLKTYQGYNTITELVIKDFSEEQSVLAKRNNLYSLMAARKQMGDALFDNALDYFRYVE